MPRKHANMSVSRTLPAKYLTAKSPLCRFRTNMPLKHANMGVSRAAARSPLNTWQPSHIYAGLEQTCHLNMPTWATCRDWIAKRNGITHNGYINCSSKTGSRPPSGKTTILKRFLKANLKAPFATNEKNLLPKHHSQLSRSHCNANHDSLQNTKVSRTHPQQRGTLTQPFHCDLRRRTFTTH